MRRSIAPRFSSAVIGPPPASPELPGRPADASPAVGPLPPGIPAALPAEPLPPAEGMLPAALPAGFVPAFPWLPWLPVPARCDPDPFVPETPPDVALTPPAWEPLPLCAPVLAKILSSRPPPLVPPEDEEDAAAAPASPLSPPEGEPPSPGRSVLGNPPPGVGKPADELAPPGIGMPLDPACPLWPLWLPLELEVPAAEPCEL